MEAQAISRTGLDVEWQRLQVIAENIANINTTRTAGGEPFRPLRLVSGPAGGFASMLKPQASAGPLAGVSVLGVEAMPDSLRRVYEPRHPHADAEGFVTYPDISLASEMTALLKTSRSYEANLAALNFAHRMYARAIDLGRRS